MDNSLLEMLLWKIQSMKEDYDTPGYIKKYGEPAPYKSLNHYLMSNHLTDEFKTPNHITFSDSSRYSAPDMQGGKWQQGGQDLWNFTPGEQNLKSHSIAELLDYFKKYERKGTFVTMPTGERSEGSR